MPRAAVSIGLSGPMPSWGSKVSRWLGPPWSQSRTQAFALAATVCWAAHAGAAKSPPRLSLTKVRRPAVSRVEPSGHEHEFGTVHQSPKDVLVAEVILRREKIPLVRGRRPADDREEELVEAVGGADFLLEDLAEGAPAGRVVVRDLLVVHEL